MSREIEEAAAVVVARLGRRPVDALEAAVALEAWGGVEAPRSLALGPSIVDLTRGRSRQWRKPLLAKGQDAVVEDPPDRAQVVGAVAVLLAIALWIAALPTFRGESMGSLALEAMPTGLGVQWFLQRRYLAGADNVGKLRAIDLPSILVVLMAVAVGWLVGGDVGGPSAALVVVWSSGMILIARGWGLAVAGVFLVAGVAGALGSPVSVNVAVVVDLCVLGAGIAVVTAPRANSPPGQWAPVMAATVVGVLMGLLVVVGLSATAVDVLSGASPALLVVILGAMWASFHLNKLWVVTLSSPVDHRGEVPGHSVRRRVAAVIQGAIARSLGVGVVSLPVGWALSWSDQGVKALVPLTAFVPAMLVVVLCSLMAGFARVNWAIGALVAGCLAAVGTRAAGVEAVSAGLALAIGSVASLLILIRPLKQMIDDPGSSIATLI